MSFQVSPGVEVREIDLTNVIPAVSTSIGGFAGYFKWGPINQVTLLSSETELARQFGKPDGSELFADPFLQAASFLQYGSALKVVRAGSETNFSNATDADTVDSPSDGVWIPNQTYFEEQFSAADGGTFAARYAGVLGNSLKVYALNTADFEAIEGSSVSEEINVFNSFDSEPEANEIHVAVVDVDGVFGVAGNVVESFSGLSVSKTAKTETGATNYIKDVINQFSRYIYLILGDSTSFTEDTFSDSPGNGVYQLSGGQEASSLTEGDIEDALDYLSDSETEDVNLLFSQIIDGSQTLQNRVHEVAYTRKDCVAFISPNKEDTIGLSSTDASSNVVTFAKDEILQRGTEGSYGVVDSGAVYIYDRYNDVYRYIPANGHVAGLCAKTDDVAEPWFSPAGFNRGGLRGIVKLAFNPNKAQRDELYKAGVNPIATFPGQGTVLFGDKTAQAKPSAFDRINVRRLFIVLEKAIATAAKFQLFELNDEFTRATFRNAVEPFLRDVQGRRGITDFAVICDETNNTGEVIDANRFVADIYIKPSRSINFITLNFIATRTGVDFAEVAGLSNS